jgi:hypothetical protein
MTLEQHARGELFCLVAKLTVGTGRVAFGVPLPACTFEAQIMQRQPL